MIEAIARPTIAVIIGPCMGAGASLAASCDLRIAADNAFFAVPAARLGLGYDPRGIKRFLRVFGASATCELIFTAGRLPAQRAHQLGTVSAAGRRRRRSSASPPSGPAGSPRTPRSRSVRPRRPSARTFPRTTHISPTPNNSTRRPMPAPTMPRAAAPSPKNERRASPATNADRSRTTAKGDRHGPSSSTARPRW